MFKKKTNQDTFLREYRKISEIPTPPPGEIYFTPGSNLLNNEKINPLVNSRNWPEWWENVDTGGGSLRNCPGTQDMLSLGYTLRMWAPIDLRPNSSKTQWELKFRTTAVDNPAMAPMFDISKFEFDQTGACPMTEIRKIKTADYPKISSPWLIKTAPGWSCLFIPVLWQPDKNYTIIPGVVNTDTYHQAHIILNPLTDGPFSIEVGTPIYQIIPFERKNIDKEIQILDETAHPYLYSSGWDNQVFLPSERRGLYNKTRRAVDKIRSKK